MSSILPNSCLIKVMNSVALNVMLRFSIFGTNRINYLYQDMNASNRSINLHYGHIVASRESLILRVPKVPIPISGQVR